MLQYQPKAKLQSQVKLYPLHWAYVKHSYSHAHVQTHKQNPWLLSAGSWCLTVTTCTEKPGPFGVPGAATALTPAQISCRSPGAITEPCRRSVVANLDQTHRRNRTTAYHGCAVRA